MKQSMGSRIAELKQNLTIEQGEHRRTKETLREANARLAIIAGENESLRKDKSWLQAMHSNLLQTLHAKER